MSALCPACGVPVVAGYVKCPKCHANLPYGAGRAKRTTADPGGTAVSASRFPFSALIVGVCVAAGIILFFGLRGGNKPTHAAPPPEPIEAQQVPQASTTPVAPPTPVVAPTPVQTPRGQTPEAAAGELVNRLRSQRLWSTTDVRSGQIDVRSSECRDPRMRPMIDAAHGMLSDAGLTKLRCLEQSGAVVFARDL